MRRSPSLTEQVRQNLKERIARDEFEDGRIPPETELASTLGVSRTTVRDALGRLENEGAIYRKQGAGTFVNHVGLQIKSRLEDIWSYEGVLSDHGYTPVVEVLSVRIEAASADDAEALGIAPEAPLIVVDKLFREDGDPVVLTSNRIPESLVAEPYEADDLRAPVYEFLERRCRRFLTSYLTDIVPVSLDAERAERLGLSDGTAVVSFDEVGYDRDNEPVVKATSYFADDLLRFRMMRRKAGA